MANFKLNISDNKGRTITKELKDKDTNPLVGVQLGNEIDAAIVGLEGKMKITGGSDKSGVPLRSDVHGGTRKYVLMSKGVGLKDAERGERVRKLVRGNTISEEVFQINCKYDGEIKIEAPPAEEKPAEEGKKKAPPAEEKPAEEGKKKAPKKE